MFPYSFYEARISLIPKWDKDTKMIKENYRPISIKHLQNKFKTSKRLLIMTKLALFQNCNDSSIWKSVNLIMYKWTQEQKLHNDLNQCKKALWQNPISHDKTSEETRNRGNTINIIKALYVKPNSSIKLNEKISKHFY